MCPAAVPLKWDGGRTLASDRTAIMRTRRGTDATPQISKWAPGIAQATDRSPSPNGGPARDAYILIDTGGDALLLVAAEHARPVPRVQSPDILANEALEWSRARGRERHRVARSETLVLLAEELSRATSTRDVVDAVHRLPASVVGGQLAVMFPHRPEVGRASAWRLLRPQFQLIDVPKPPMLPSSFVHAPVLFRRSDRHAARENEAFLAPLFQHTGAETLALAGMGEHAVVLVIDRRRASERDPDDWYVLRTTARLGEAALTRVGLDI